MDSYNRYDLLYYASKPVYWVWLIIGLFTIYYPLMITILILPTIKFLVILFRSDKINKYYDIVTSIIKIIALLLILSNYLGLFLLLL